MGMDETASATLHKAVGCARCNHQGYRGRAGIYEFIEIDETLRSLIHNKASEAEMTLQARKHWPGIFDDGRRRILAGETTLEEVFRVTAG
jgi:general secretion pathway protein E